MVRTAKRISVAHGPIGQASFASCGRIRVEKTAHQGVDFIASQDNVPHCRTNGPANQVSNGRLHGDHPSSNGDNPCNLLHELAIGESLRSDRVHDDIVVLHSASNRQIGKIINVNRSDSVRAIAKNSKDGKTPQYPGDVVDEDVLAAEQNGRPKYRIGQPRISHRPFQACFSSIVFERRVLRGVGNANVHDSAHTRIARGAKQSQAVFNRLRSCEAPVVEADPIGVVENGRALQRLHQLLRPIEIVRKRADAPIERIVASNRIRKGTNGQSLVKQSLGNTTTRVSECPCDDVDLLRFHGISSVGPQRMIRTAAIHGTSFNSFRTITGKKRIDA